MKIKDLNEKEITSDNSINSKFLSVDHNELKMNCKILKTTFYSDSFNYFPITLENHTFKNSFSWGDKAKYKNFYNSKFQTNFDNKKKNFKKYSNVVLLGSSALNNYYRNLITFLPRIFFINDENISLAIHRNSSNKFREFLIKAFSVLNKKITKFIYLDDEFYCFENSQIPQFFKKEINIKILNKMLKSNNNTRKKNKIYITRQNASYRKVINEGDLIEDLKSKGFVIIDTHNLSIEEQIIIFSNAKVIISPSGSALSNLVFCEKGTNVIEIMPNYKNQNEDIFKHRYSEICNYLNLNYEVFYADSINKEVIEPKLKEFIDERLLKSSSYYKNLLVKKNEFIKFIEKY